MQKDKDPIIPFPDAGYRFDGTDFKTDSFDPMGRYTGRTADKDENPVQNVDDL